MTGTNPKRSRSTVNCQDDRSFTQGDVVATSPLPSPHVGECQQGVNKQDNGPGNANAYQKGLLPGQDEPADSKSWNAYSQGKASDRGHQGEKRLEVVNLAVHVLWLKAVAQQLKKLDKLAERSPFLL